MDQEASVDPSVRACKELFELLTELCGGNKKGAATVWERAFWVKFNGENPLALTENEVPEFAGWIVGATKLLHALKDSGFFEK